MKVELIDSMGTDLSVVNSARVSFDKESEWAFWNDWSNSGVLLEEDARLIKYLAKHNHWTPFAHTCVTLRVSAPVPIRTQCFKHKQGLVENEESRRYIKSDPEFYTPDCWRRKADNAKQGSSSDTIEFMPSLNSGSYVSITDAYKLHLLRSASLYKHMINAGVCPEQARFVLPQGTMVNWIWTGNLYAFANFYNKRTDPHAQAEVQTVAHKVGDIIQTLFPVSWEALTKDYTNV